MLYEQLNEKFLNCVPYFDLNANECGRRLATSESI